MADGPGRKPKRPEEHYTPLRARITQVQKFYLEWCRGIPNVSRFIREAVHLHLLFFFWSDRASEYEGKLFQDMLDLLAHDDHYLSRIDPLVCEDEYLKEKAFSKFTELKTKEGGEIEVFDAADFFLEGIRKMAPTLLKDIAKKATAISKCSFEKTFRSIRIASERTIMKLDQIPDPPVLPADPLEMIVVVSFLLDVLNRIAEWEKLSPEQERERIEKVTKQYLAFRDKMSREGKSWDEAAREWDEEQRGKEGKK